MRLSRTGMVLAELVVAATLTVLVAGLALGGLVGLQRAVARHAERVALQNGLRAAAHLARTELRDAGIGGGGDLISFSPTSIVYRAVRGTGLSCGQAAGSLLVSSASLRAIRLPSPGRDSVLVLTGDAARPDSMRWVIAPLMAAPRSAVCADGAPALALPMVPADLLAVGIRTPVRIVELMELRLYRSGTSWWLGLRSVSGGETIQPVAGPFDADGVAFRFLGLAGTETPVPGDVISVEMRQRGQTATEQGAGGAASGGPSIRDSLVLLIPLRNADR
jgi:hypothetical protein